MEIAIHTKGQDLLPPTDASIEIRNLEKELLHERDRTLRALADFTNYRRRMERDGKKISDEGKREIILTLLDVVDDFEKALEWSDGESVPFVQGIRGIQRKFVSLLESQGVSSFDCVGMQFNHEFHEAVAMAKDEGYEPGIIINELRRGYLWKNELLRPAQVRVAG